MARREWTGVAAGVAFASVMLARAGEAAAAPPGDPCARASCSTLRGVVARAGDRRPLPSARVLVVPETTTRKPGDVPRRHHLREGQTPAWLRAGTTDAEGRFAIDDVPSGRLRVVVVADGFVRQETIVVAVADEPLRKLFVEPVAGDPFRTVVAQKPRRSDAPQSSSTALTREEIATMPGTQGDPLRAIQSLPGVGRSPGGLGMIVLRGAAPNQSRVFYGEHPIPRAFHVLGFSSVMQADVLDGLDVQPSTFGARWGQATGGVVLLRPRRGRRDGVHGHAKADLISAGARVEGPLGRGSYLIAAQRGYVDAVLQVVEKVDPTAVFALPRYYDYQAQYDLHTRHGADLTVRAIGSGDRWRGRYLDDTGRRVEGFVLTDNFHRLELVHARQTARWRTLFTPAVRFDAARATGEMYAGTRRGVVVSARAEVERAFTQRFSLTLGTDLVVSPFRVHTQDSTFATMPTSRTIEGFDATVGLYAVGTLRLGRVTLWPGVRISGFARRAPENTGVQHSEAHAFDPRVLARWDVAKRWSLRGGVGLYSQLDDVAMSGSDGLFGSGNSLGAGRVELPPALQQALDPQIGVGELDDIVNVLTALHGSAGVTWTSRFGLTLDATAFTRHLVAPQSYVTTGTGPGLPPRSRQPYTVEAQTRTWGAELLLRQRVADRLFAWLGYTIMRSDVIDRDVRPPVRRPSSYEQRHNLVALASYALPRHFRLGARFRVVSGSPYTPVVGTIVTEYATVGVRGRTNSARFPVFHQLDVRLDKTWYRKRTTWTAYVDVQNVYNHQNVEALIYAADYRSVIGTLGLPIFPSLGVRLDW
ncbi:MAG: TonB-dependent receptor [Nannocystaceae bacterium]|nr:TonB-dependent receptor [Nannocystaceae bacterium]